MYHIFYLDSCWVASVRKAFVVDQAFYTTTVNKEIQIDLHQEIIVKKVYNEWQEYIDINGLAKVEDCSKF